MRRILKIFLIVCALSLHISAEKNNVKTKQTINTKPQTYRRVLPADVLRGRPILYVYVYVYRFTYIFRINLTYY